jgi:hypothetical protein
MEGFPPFKNYMNFSILHISYLHILYLLFELFIDSQ